MRTGHCCATRGVLSSVYEPTNHNSAFPSRTGPTMWGDQPPSALTHTVAVRAPRSTHEPIVATERLPILTPMLVAGFIAVVFVLMAARIVGTLNLRNGFVITGLSLLAVIALFLGAWRSGKERVAAAQAAERFRVTLASIGDAVIATDEQGRVIGMNAVAQALTGWTEADATGKRLEEVFVIVNEETRLPAENPVGRALRENTIVGLANHTVLISKDGRELPVDDSAAPIRTADGRVTGVVLVFRDVTERRRVERERTALVEAERVARLEAEAAEQRLRFALDAGRMGTWQYTMRSGEVIWSRGLEAIHGFAPGTFPGTFEAFQAEIHPEDRARVQQAIAEAVDERRAHHVEYRIVRQDGVLRWVEGRGQLFCDAHGTPERMVGVCSDVTERIHAEELFRLAVEAAPSAMIMIDQAGTIRHANALTEQILGYARAEILGQSIDQLVPERFRGRHAGYRSGFFADSRQRPMGSGRDLYALRKDGSEVAVEIGLSPINTADGLFVLAAITDITERKRAQRALAEQAHLLDLTQDAVFVCDLAYRIVYWNQGAENLYGWSRSEAIGRVTYDLLGTVFPQPLDEIVAAVHREGQWSGDLTHTRRDGAQIDVASRWTLDRDSEGRPAAILEINNDITVRKKLEEAERRAREDAERVNRVKDAFLAVVSHELRTPLNSILGWATLLNSDILPPEKSRAATQAIERAARVEAQLVESLLDLTRIMAGKLDLALEPLDMASVVNIAVEMVRPDAEANELTLDVQLPLSPIIVVADGTRLQQVAWNLLTNAVKFTPRQGKVEVVVERTDAHVEMRVKDNGQGITAEFLPHGFDRFAQAASKERLRVGLGLGLAIVRELVHAHGGTIQADSPGAGQGSTFVVRLPLTSVASGTAA